MVLCMTRPTSRPGSKFKLFRKRVPADVQRVAQGRPVSIRFESGGDDPITVTATLGREVKFSLRTSDPSVAKQRTATAIAQLEALYAALRVGPRPLTRRQRIALAGDLYKLLQEVFFDDPADAKWWDIVQEFTRAALDGKLLDLRISAAGVPDAALERYVGPFVDAVLNARSLVPNRESRAQLLRESAKALIQVAGTLQRNAHGDYRPDLEAERFPKWADVAPTSVPRAVGGPSLSFDAMFEKWCQERKPSASTITTWKGHVRALAKHLGHDDPRRVTKGDLVAWKDALVAADYDRKSIKNGQLAAVRAIFKYAVDNGLVNGNPAQDVTVRVPKGGSARMLPYTDEEVARLLSFADKEDNPQRKWLPWLLALTGARVGEVAQLWGKRVKEVDGIKVIEIAPAEDGGSLKNEGSARLVPLHPALIERGFFQFVRERGQGPLFYRGTKKANPGAAASRHASKGVANHLADWVRKKGFTDPRKAPNHALRHWFKTACVKAEVLESVADAIQGHKGKRGVADAYRHFDIELLASAVNRLKVPIRR